MRVVLSSLLGTAGLAGLMATHTEPRPLRPAAHAPAAAAIRANDNRRPAGRLANGVLTLALEAREKDLSHPANGERHEQRVAAELGRLERPQARLGGRLVQRPH